VRVVPERGIDVGAGTGKAIEKEIEGGVVGVVVDARGRTYRIGLDATGKEFQEAAVSLPEDGDERIQALKRWHKALGIYPDYDL